MEFNKHQLAMAMESAIERLNLLDLKDTQTSVENLISSFNITSLPPEIILQILEICQLKDLLSLSKVCQLFLHLISQILQKRYRNFIYNYLNFKFSLNLEDTEISQLCLLCGKNVTRLRFSTYFNMDLLKFIEWKMGCNPMENLKFFINDNFKQNLQYFPNLQDLEIQGKFVQDLTFLELAKRCKKLQSIRLIDGDNRWLKGEDFADLESVEHLDLKCCRNLEPKHLMTLSQKRQLKTLNIVECELLKDIHQIVKLCRHWQHLHTLRLTAFTQDPVLLKAILALPSLKCLQFFWVNFMPLQFEENFFQELKENSQKSQSLTWLKFENDRYYIEDESLQVWTEQTYATMRENVCINGQLWQWTDEMFEKISKSLELFTQLKTLIFRYCRLLSYDQLRKLPEVNKSLSLISCHGCPRKEDQQFLKEWLETNRVRDGCQLKFECILGPKEVMNLQTEATSRQFSSYYRREPVMRSIECQF